MNVVLVFLRNLRGPESKPAILRVVIVGLVLAVVWVLPHSRPDVMLGLAAFFVYGVLGVAAIGIWPPSKVRRRSMVITDMVVDVAGTTWFMVLLDQAGVMLFWIYLFNTLGYGFRYGRAYMVACQALCVVGFTVVLFMAPWWQMNPMVGVGLLIPLIVLPLYVGYLLHLLQQRLQQQLQQQKAPVSG